MEGPSPGLRGGFVFAVVPEAPIVLVPEVPPVEQAASKLNKPAIIISLNIPNSSVAALIQRRRIGRMLRRGMKHKCQDARLFVGQGAVIR